MYEITVIESLTSGGTVMASIPCNDDEIEIVARNLISDEDTCVAQGVVLNYTTITHYYPNRDAYKHYAPPPVTSMNRNDL